jgi:LruC domain-containing protein
VIRKHLAICFCLLALSVADLAQAAVSSVRLRDVISQGQGNIDLLQASVRSRDPTPAQLEEFRSLNGGKLVFAIDVNEAASGTEKSSSQGVAIESAWIEVTVGGVMTRYDARGCADGEADPTTKTRTALARLGQTSRSLYCTLIGDAGSRTVTSSTSSDINLSSFDATLRIPVSANLGSATAVRLVIRFLDTNQSLGDPEAFYDYSNGFEDVALATPQDALYLDQLAAGRDEAPLVMQTDTSTQPSTSRIYYPSKDQFYVVAYEDQFPKRGDYDFNDLVVGYRVYYELDAQGRATGGGGEGYLIARGGGFDHDWHLRLALPSTASGQGALSVSLPEQLHPAPSYPRSFSFNGAVDLEVFVNTASLWVASGFNFVNTLKDQDVLIRGHRFSFEFQLGSSIATSQLPAAPFDPYLYVHNTGYEIHLPGKTAVLGGSRNTRDGLTSFSDPAGYPFALIIPESWEVPVEYIDLGIAYPEFLDYVQSTGSQGVGWYDRPAAQRTKPTLPSLWKW